MGSSALFSLIQTYIRYKIYYHCLYYFSSIYQTNVLFSVHPRFCFVSQLWIPFYRICVRKYSLLFPNKLYYCGDMPLFFGKGISIWSILHAIIYQTEKYNEYKYRNQLPESGKQNQCCCRRHCRNLHDAFESHFKPPVRHGQIFLPLYLNRWRKFPCR